ncbi:TPA: hypothetical protein ACIGVJ_000567 [Legionella pneumophila]
MNTLSLNIQYRPIRIGLCIRENNLQDYDKALRLTHTLWGGRYNPLIPVGDIDAATKMIEFFKVDLLLPISDDKNIINFINKFPYLSWPNHIESKLFSKWSKVKEPMFLDIFQAALLLRSDLNKEHALSQNQLTFVNWEEDDPLSHVFIAMFGSLPSTEEIDADFNYKKILANTLTTNDVFLTPDQPIDLTLTESLFLNQLTTYSLYIQQALSGWTTPGMYIGSANDFSDLVCFWNLRACGISLVFYDYSFQERFSSLKQEQINLILSLPPPDYESVPRIGIWLQERNQGMLKTDEFKEQITVCHLSPSTWNGLNIKNIKCHFLGQTVLGIVSDQTLSFSLPSKPIPNERVFLNHHLIASIDIYGDISSGDETFHFPYLPQLNLFYGQNTFQHEKVRIEPKGIGIIIQHHDTNLHLQSISIQKLAQAIFHQFGMNICLSDAGIKALQIIKQLGGLLNCRVFRLSGFRRLIEEYSPSDAFTRSSATKLIGEIDPETNKANIDRYNMYLDGRRVNPSSVFNFLANKEVFRAGVELKCPNCNLKFWRLIDDVKTKAACEFCSDVFNILSQLKDKNWLYRRSGIFGLNDNQAGSIPVVLTLNQLHLHFHTQKFMYVTAMNVSFNGKKKKCETDFIILTSDHNGKLSIVISECKTRCGIELEDVQNLSRIADALSNDYIDTYILFSKLTDFSDDEIALCSQAQQQFRDRVILLTPRELESPHLYDETSKLFQIDKYASDWERMVHNTKAIFFEKKKL